MSAAAAKVLSHFSRVRLCVTPQTAAHQAPPSLGFSRHNTGVGCHFLLQRMKLKSENEATQSRPHGLQPTRLLHPWDFPGKSPGVGCHGLLRKSPYLIQLINSSFSHSLAWLCFLVQHPRVNPGEATATHSSILAWRIPWTEQSMGSQRVGQD